MSFTVNDLIDAYPSSDLLPIDENATHEMIEEMERDGELGDPLFLFLVREAFDNPRGEPVSKEEVVQRIERAAQQLAETADNLYDLIHPSEDSKDEE